MNHEFSYSCGNRMIFVAKFYCLLNEVNNTAKGLSFLHIIKFIDANLHENGPKTNVYTVIVIKMKENAKFMLS